MKREGLKRGLVISLLVLGACASTDFWKTPIYVLDHQNAHLRATDPKDDLEIRVCDPDEQSKAKCYVLLREDYIALRKDYNELKQRVIDLEKECPK